VIVILSFFCFVMVRVCSEHESEQDHMPLHHLRHCMFMHDPYGRRCLEEILAIAFLD